MKITRIVLAFIAAASVSFAASAQTVDEIIAKHTDALGGKDNLAKIKTLYVESTAEVMGSEAPASTAIVDGKGYLGQLEVNGAKIVQCYTDKSGWIINPYAGASDPTPMPADQYEAGKYDIYISGVLVEYAAKGYKAELLGKDGNDYKIKMTLGKDESIYYVDATTYLVSKITRKANTQGEMADITVTLSDYQKADGFVFPHKTIVDLGQIQLNYTVKTVTLNKAIDPKIFDMPVK